MLTIVYFAWVREIVGKDEERMVRPDAGVTVADVVRMLASRGEPYAQAFADQARLRAAIDQRFVPMETPVGDARELALFPPVTGG